MMATPHILVDFAGRRLCRPENGNAGRTRRRNSRGDLWCYECRRYLSPEAFTRHRKSSTGRAVYCRNCASLYRRRRLLERAIAGDPRLEEALQRSYACKAEIHRRHYAEAREERRWLADRALALIDDGLVRSDRELAGRLGISRQAVTWWRQSPDAAPLTRTAKRIEQLLEEVRRRPEPFRG